MSFLIILVKWFTIGVVFGILFNVLWAWFFWENNALFYYHWAAVPLSMMIVGAGTLIEFLLDHDY